MRYVKVSKQEMQRSDALFEGVMSQASQGLLFRCGAITGDELAKSAGGDGDEFWENVGKLLVGRGWVDEATMDAARASFKGSMEAGYSKEGCHRLRGIVKAIYESRLGCKVNVIEEKCEGQGSKNCIFKIEVMGRGF